MWGTSTLEGRLHDVVGELGVGGHTVVRGWVWSGAVNQEILSNAREVRQSRGFSSTKVCLELRSRVCETKGCATFGLEIRLNGLLAK